jgi:hypothetical protein
MQPAYNLGVGYCVNLAHNSPRTAWASCVLDLHSTTRSCIRRLYAAVLDSFGQVYLTTCPYIIRINLLVGYHISCVLIGYATIVGYQ